MTPTSGIEFLLWLLIAAAVIAMLAKRLRIPYTASLVVGGLQAVPVDVETLPLEFLTDGSLDSFEKSLGEFFQRNDASSIAEFDFEFHIHTRSSRSLQGIQRSGENVELAKKFVASLPPWHMRERGICAIKGLAALGAQ